MNWDKKFTTWIGSGSSVVLHTIFFVVMFCLPFFGVPTDKALLILTTIVSLEAIYLAIFIQMTVNENTESLKEVEEDIEEISEDVEEISEDVVEISKDIDEIQTDVDEIQTDVDEIQADVDEIEKDTEIIQDQDKKDKSDFDDIHKLLLKVTEELERLKNR